MPKAKTRFCRWNRSSGSFRRGSETYRLHLDDRNVETFARRRFGCTHAFHRLPGDLDFVMACTWV